MKSQLLDTFYTTSRCLSEQEVQTYLDGNIDKELRLRVENHLLDCELCSDAMDGFQEMGFSSLQLELPESFFQTNDSQTLAPKPKVRMLTRTLLRVAAVVSILLVSYFTFFRAPSYDQLYNDFYTSYPLDIPLNSRTSNADLPAIDVNFESGLLSYSNGDFESSLSFFQSALQNEPGNSAILFFSGVACMESGKYEEAINFLVDAKEADSLYSAKAIWYLALTYLKLGNNEKAIQELDALLDMKSYHFAEAKKLKSKLT